MTKLKIQGDFEMCTIKLVASGFRYIIVAVVGPKEYLLQAEKQILERVEEEPNISTRRLAAEVGVSQFVVHRTLKEYHFQKVQALELADCPRRVIYCEWLLQRCREPPNFLNCILFTDEAGFTRNAVFNSDNTHIWSDENLHARQKVRFQRGLSISVWTGFVNGHLDLIFYQTD